MAAGGPSTAEGSLLALICDEDTATGLLLTGVGHVDYRKQSNFLIVDDSEWARRSRKPLGACWGLTLQHRRRL